MGKKCVLYWEVVHFLLEVSTSIDFIYLHSINPADALFSLADHEAGAEVSQLLPPADAAPQRLRGGHRSQPTTSSQLPPPPPPPPCRLLSREETTLGWQEAREETSRSAKEEVPPG